MILPVILVLLVTLSLLALGHTLNNKRMVNIIGIAGITLLSVILLGYSLLILSIEYQIPPPWIHNHQEKTFNDVVNEMQHQEH